MNFSVIIPLYNRPDEVAELLASLCQQEVAPFEVIVVEDGSTISSKEQVMAFSKMVNLTYVFQENTGQGFARNHGMAVASGDFFVFFDSDCVVPPTYFSALSKAILAENLDAFGGPDDAGQNFSPFQKAMNFSMTSLLTTGGIRGKMRNAEKYQARGYNMGFSRRVFKAVGGFLDPNRAEDVEISIRIKKAGYKLALVKDAFVYHHRKNTLQSFLKQSFQFGSNRVFITRYHPEAIQLVHLLPLGFLFGIFAMVVSTMAFPWLFSILALMHLLWSFALFAAAAFEYGSIKVGLLAVITSIGQLCAYGAGFMKQLIFKYFF
jgi:glycosyltransferase involved in cell wall biosynthesis